MNEHIPNMHPDLPRTSQVWVVNALTLVTRVHKQLGPEGYRSVTEFGPDDTMTAVRVPSVTMCLSTLGLHPA
jgi:hypothetical protein